jgi:peptide/nickel transport system substrate-binding protein
LSAAWKAQLGSCAAASGSTSPTTDDDRASRFSARHAVRALVLALVLLAWPGWLHAASEGTMTWGVHTSLAARWLDPAETEGTIIPFMMLYALHDALLKPMPAGFGTPSLAVSWTMSKDGLMYEFVLRNGIKFHNGDPVTAEDVKFSYERHQGTGVNEFRSRVQRVDFVDPITVRFHLKEPRPERPTYNDPEA